MTHLPLKIIAVALLAAVPGLLSAQSDTSAIEDLRMSELIRNQGQFTGPRHHLSVGFRMLNAGGKVDFGNLGTVPNLNPIIPASEGAVARTYDNGAVGVDSPRAAEVDTDGNQTSTPGGRYTVDSTFTQNVVDADGNVTGTEEVTALYGDYLSYTPGLTRNWLANTQGQLSEMPGYVGFSHYSAISEGGSMSNEQGATAGVEFQLSRDMGRGSRRFQWGLAGGVALNNINSKVAGTVNSTLRTYTDYYSLNGLTAPLEQLSNPYVDSTLDTNGDGYLNEYELTVPISAIPDGSLTTDTLVPGGASVTGNWQVKGAYFLIKLGPTLRTRLTERLGITASLGVAGAYAGTRFSATESFNVPELPDVTLATQDPETGATIISSTEAKFLTGYYADLNLEWDANERFGLYGGVTAQKLGDYDQTLGERTAKIDLGSAVGIRGGVSIRF